MALRRWIKKLGDVAPLAGDFKESFTLRGGIPPRNELTVTFQTFSSDVDAVVRLADAWQQLELQADGSFFLGWAWISTWLREIVRKSPLLLVEVTDHSQLIGLAFLPVLERRIAGLRTRVACFNEVPLPARDMIVEKNGCLALKGCERAVFAAIIEGLAKSTLKVDEILCRAIDARYLSGWAEARFHRTATDKTAPCWLLGKAASSGALKRLEFDDLVSSLSKSRRWQIRRFLKMAESEYGPLNVDVAATEEKAAEYFAAMGQLHTGYWQRQGLPGVFRSARWRSFHWRLILRLLPQGRVHLVRIAAGQQEVGFLYNVVHGAEVSNIQSGFYYLSDNRWRPGYASHLLAAHAAGERGCDSYDLLMGDDGYKASIATAGTQLHWFSLFPRRRVNPRYWLWCLLEAYRWVRTSSRPKAQGELRS